MPMHILYYTPLAGWSGGLAQAHKFRAPVSETKFPATTRETAGAEDGAMRHGKPTP